jgi:histidinol-phosphate aminotransferase
MTGVRDLVSVEIQRLTAYQVPHPQGIRARLDANECPYPLAPALAEELAQVMARVDVNRYPDGGARELRNRVARDLGCAPEQLVAGNGSDELIALLVATFSRPRRADGRPRVAYPVPSFVVYRIASIAHGAVPVEIPLRDDFTLDPERLERALAEERPNLVFLALPNNPTGTLWPRDVVLEAVERHPDVLIVADEAYFDYCGETLLDAVPRHENLVVMRTLSKMGLAALRCGFLVAHAALAQEVEKIRPPYNVGAVNQAAATWLLTHHREELLAACRRVGAEREGLVRALSALPDMTVFPTRANFVLTRHPRATWLWERLVERGVLVRNFDRPGPLAGCLRITVGTPEENRLLLGALDAITRPVSAAR